MSGDPFARREFQRFVKQCGNGDDALPAAFTRAALALGVSVSMVRALYYGQRALSPRLALEAERASRELSPSDPVDKAILIWGREGLG